MEKRRVNSFLDTRTLYPVLSQSVTERRDYSKWCLSRDLTKRLEDGKLESDIDKALLSISHPAILFAALELTFKNTLNQTWSERYPRSCSLYLDDSNHLISFIWMRKIACV